MRRARIWLLLYFGCLFGGCPGMAAAEPSNGSETKPPLEEDTYQAYVGKIAKAQ